MSVKKSLILGAVAGVASLGLAASAFAGGPDYYTPATDNGVYIDVNGGYNYSNYAGEDGLDALTSNSHGAFTVGADLGYQFNRYLALELGWYWLGTANVAPEGTPAININSNWAAYLGPKLMVPLFAMSNVDVFVKAGVAYRTYNLNVTSNEEESVFNIGANTTFHKWSPMFALGGEYHFDQNWRFNAQYTRFVEGTFNSSAGNLYTVSSNLFTIGLGYLFTM